MQAAKVYLIDHHTEPRTELAFSLQGEGIKVHAFNGVPSFLQWLDYDLMHGETCVVTELDMPEMTGVELCNVLEADEVQLPVLFMHDVECRTDSLRWARENGIPVIDKTADLQLLATRIQNAIQRQCREMRKENEIGPAITPRSLRGRIAALSPREMEVLAYVFDGLLNKLIADRLDISVKTVEMHRANMMKKMQASSTIDLIKMLAFNGGAPQLHS